MKTMKTLLIASILLLPLSVSAEGRGHGPQPAQNTAESDASVSGVMSGAAASVSGNAPVVLGDYYEDGARRTNDSNSKLSYSGEYKVKNVPGVIAPALTTTMTETCMGSTSGGGAVAGFGITFGTTWRDSACVRRLDSREVRAIGYQLGAKEMMCDSEKVREAMIRSGNPCFNDLPSALQTQLKQQQLDQLTKQIVATQVVQ